MLLHVSLLSLASPSNFQLASQHLKLGDFNTARIHFEKHHSLHPDHEPTIAVLAHLDELGVTRALDDEDARFHEAVLTFPSREHGDDDVPVHLLTPSRPQGLACDSSGHAVWSGAPALLEWAGSGGEESVPLRGARVLELVSGTGLVGCGMAKLGAKSVTCTDLPQIMPLLQANVAANADAASASGCSLRAQPLVWGSEAGPATGDQTFDLITAANVCYDEELVAPLALTLRSLLTAHTGAMALLALSDLRHFGHDAPDYECLLGDLRHGGLRVSQVGSLDPSKACARLAGVVDVADAHRDHMIDLFTVCAA